jgi:hypothetical protein
MIQSAALHLKLTGPGQCYGGKARSDSSQEKSRAHRKQRPNILINKELKLVVSQVGESYPSAFAIVARQSAYFML